MLSISYSKDCLIPDVPLNPLLAFASSNSNPKQFNWSSCKNPPKDLVNVNCFHEIDEAGPLVIIPSTLGAYKNSGNLQSILKFHQKVLATGRTVIIFTGGIEYKPKPGEIVFATSTYESNKEKSIPLPNWLCDLKDEITPITKPVSPTIGFVGDTKYPGKLSNLLGDLPIPNSIVCLLGNSMTINRNLSLNARQAIARLVRQRTMQAVRKANGLQPCLVERSGGFFNNSPEVRAHYRLEYLKNIQDNAYQLCVRGDENSSYRLYEVMSACRIPIIIDTNMKLPKLSRINWEDFSIIVPFRKIDEIGERVTAFHNSISSADFDKICRTSRLAFEALAPDKFFRYALKEMFQDSF